MYHVVRPGLAQSAAFENGGSSGKRGRSVTTYAIQTTDLTKRYGQVTALNGLDLAIAEGEVIGYLGPNGAGKTTTIRLLLGLARATRGRAEIFGLDCEHQAV
jgi:ABC-2 type transport system ATP-binding protein